MATIGGDVCRITDSNSGTKEPETPEEQRKREQCLIFRCSNLKNRGWDASTTEHFE
jgi:hypothetical protein